MKIVLGFIIFLGISLSMVGQEDNLSDVDIVFLIADEMPEFPGCENIDTQDFGVCQKEKIITFLQDHFTYPNTQGCFDGTMIVSFFIDKDEGRVKDAKIVRSIHAVFDEQLLKVVYEMPNWRPGFQNGRAVDVRMMIPFRIGLH